MKTTPRRYRHPNQSRYRSPNRTIREIQNYRNGRKTQENIPFEIKKIIDSSGMDSEGMEGKPRKIFGYKV